MPRITNVDVTVHPQHLAHVTLQVLLQEQILIRGLVPIVLKLADRVLSEEKEPPSVQFFDSVERTVLELKAWLAQYGELTILPDQDTPSAVPPTP